MQIVLTFAMVTLCRSMPTWPDVLAATGVSSMEGAKV